MSDPREFPNAEDQADSTPASRWRTVWISDVHLGTPGSRAEALLEFLRATDCETLYLVGDIVDGWQLQRRWYWRQSHNDVLQKILRKARKGTRVILIPGNHDEAARAFAGLSFGGIEIQLEAEHICADGRRLLVLHGDLFDAVVRGAKWLAHLGDGLYHLALRLNRSFNSVRARLGLPYWSLSQYLKHRVKNAVNYISEFEAALAREAAERRYDGIVCGHIHRPEVRQIHGVTYANCGDWVESLSALVETPAGELRVVYWVPGLSSNTQQQPTRAHPATPSWGGSVRALSGRLVGA
jgi:UDP-2,3-diacylglucosamine pyrophosphatase LpxH